MTIALVALGILALLGHLMFWVGVFNKVHATALPYLFIKPFEKLVYVIVVTVPLAVVLIAAKTDFSAQSLDAFFASHVWLTLYLTLCLGVLAMGTPVWLQQRLARDPAALVDRHITKHKVRDAQGRRPVGDLKGRLFASVPFNESLDMHVEEKTLVLPRLPAALDGLTIAHLSDLHFTGHIDRSFFEFIIDRTIELDADLAVVTGDLVDKVACIDWVQPLFSRLRARHGVYCILGNHDKRLKNEVGRLRREIVAAGMVDLGGKTTSASIRDQRVWLAGNELPWFGPAPDIAPITNSGQGRDDFRLLLSHSPDQIDWAVQHQFDLMLAGHTHGGQIRFPIIGPIVAPSRYGVKFASGTFAKGPTVMHVSRGLSGLDPVRLGCPPELAKLILRTSMPR